MIPAAAPHPRPRVRTSPSSGASTAPARRPERQLPPLRLVPDQARRRPASRRRARRRARLLVVSAVVLVLAGLFGLAASHALLAQGQMRLDRLEARVGDQQERYQRLRLQVAELESPERVVAVAQERLGMVPPPGVTYLSPRGAVADEVPPDAALPGERGEGRPWTAVKPYLESSR